MQELLDFEVVNRQSLCLTDCFPNKFTVQSSLRLLVDKGSFGGLEVSGYNILCLIWILKTIRSVFWWKKKNEGLIELENTLFFLFSLFCCLFGSLRHDYNLKSIFDFDLYLKFAKA